MVRSGARIRERLRDADHGPLRYRKYGDVLLVPAESDLDPDQRGLGINLNFTAENETVEEIAEQALGADAAVAEWILATVVRAADEPVDRRGNIRRDS